MARNKKNRSGGTRDDSAQQAVRDSAQKIWLAGLGAFERAKTDGPRMFETLVEQGRNMGARAVGAADEALKNLRQANYGSGQWDKLEQVFEERVSRSLGRLGVVTSREVDALSKQVQELNEHVRNLMSGGAGAPRKGSARKTASRTKKKAGAKAGAARKRASRG